MAKIIIDLSGQLGLLERHQGDLNDTSAVPNLRYIGEDGSFADGIFNPMKSYGYMSPANNTFRTLTGTIAAPINSIQYDSESDTVFLSEEGENILQLNGLADTSLTNYLSVATGSTIKDAVIYEANSAKALVYIVDSNTPVTYSDASSTIHTGGTYIGFKTLDETEGLNVLENKIVDYSFTSNKGYLFGVTSVAGQDYATYKVRRVAQQINTSDFYSATDFTNGTLDVSGVTMAISREAGTGVGITMKVSIQAQASASTAPYTARGAWGSGVSYAVNDTVTNGGFTWQCHSAHTSAAGDQPGVGGAWEDKWDRFGAPDGTDLASATVSLDEISDYGNNSKNRYTFTFSSPVSLTRATNYWIVLQESGTNMSGSTDKCSWMMTANGQGLYQRYAKVFLDAATDYWRGINANGDTLTANHDDFDFTLNLNRSDDWSLNTASGKFTVETGGDGFLYVAENALLYWITGNKVHTVDGSSTGGFVGKVSDTVLLFPSYIEIADVAETRSRMYLGIQTTNRTSSTDGKTFGANKIGVYIWDKRTQVQGQTDFYPCPGAREIKSVFTSSTGDVLVITISNSGFTEIRGISGNQYAVLHTFERNGYPPSRRGISQVDNMSVWCGANGIYYAYGSITNSQKRQLYKIGTMAGEVENNLTMGPIFVGHEEDNEPRISIISGFSGTTPALTETVLDENSTATTSGVIISSGGTYSARGQSFFGEGGYLERVTFSLNKSGGSPTGTVTAKLYRASDIALMATSTAVSITDLPATEDDYSFDFSSSNFELVDGEEYVVVVDATNVTSGSITMWSSASSHSGQGWNRTTLDVWSTYSEDFAFAVYHKIPASFMIKWYPNGDGTIDSVAQKPNQGNIYTKVYTIPSLGTIKYLRLLMAPGVSTGTTVIANLKCYYNQSATAAWTKAITLDDIHKGWKNIEINKNDVNFIQFEIEYVDTITLGDSDFKPMYIELEYDDEKRINP